MLTLLVVSLSFIVEPTNPFASLTLDTLLSSFFIFGYSALSFMPLAPAWSIDIEMQFYLLAPLIVFALNRNPLIVALLIITLGVISNCSGDIKTLASLLPWFLIGMLVAKYSDYVRANNLGKWSAIVIIFMLTLFTLIPSLHPILFGGAYPSSLWIKFNSALNIVLALIAMPFVFTTVFNMGGKYDRLYSDLSYSLYLFHWIPLLVVSHYFPEVNQKPFLLRLPFSLGMLLIIYAVSIGITLWIDRPLNKFRSGFVRDRAIILK
jgi:peptidoglycan/LPS O-acetylase OafA/YrhL